MHSPAFHLHQFDDETFPFNKVLMGLSLVAHSLAGHGRLSRVREFKSLSNKKSCKSDRVHLECKWTLDPNTKGGVAQRFRHEFFWAAIPV